MIIFSELDMLGGAAIYERTLTLHETRPFSENFDSFGNGDMLFLMNSGSTMIVLLIIFCWTPVMMMIHRVTRPFGRNLIMRNISMFAEGQVGLMYPLIKLFYEGYMELTIPAIMGTVAIFANMDAPSVGTWFGTNDDRLSSIATLLVFIIVISLPPFVQWLMNQGKNLL
jgi:hypothetical protein